MALSRGETLAVGLIGASVAGVLGLLKDLPAELAKAIGWPLTALLVVLLAGYLVAMAALYFHYVAAVEGAGGDARGPARRDYLALRGSMRAGGGAAAAYGFWLRRLLAAVDRFFGDAQGPMSARQCRWFGLDTAAPLWSAPAYHRCLLLALAYPLAMVFVGWTLSGHVGQAEEALGFKVASNAWVRGLALASTVALIFSAFRAMTASGLKDSLLWLMVWVCAIAGAGAAAIVGAVAVDSVVTVVGAFAGAFAVSGAVVLSKADARVRAVWAAVSRAKEGHWQGSYNLGFTVVMTLATLLLAAATWSAPRGDRSDAVLMFFGILTLANAPFDWLSLGLTRGLLRCGLQRGGGWPAGLALLDALLATLLLIPLCAVMVLAVQGFDALALHSGKPAVLPLAPFFDGLRATPSAPEFYWIWALLVTTLLPSLVNAVLGCASLLRGIPSLNRWVLAQMPEKRAAAESLVHHRLRVAGVLTAQWALGIPLGIAGLGLWVWGMCFELMPRLGLNLLELMRLLERQQWPQRLIAAWA